MSMCDEIFTPNEPAVTPLRNGTIQIADTELGYFVAYQPYGRRRFADSTVFQFSHNPDVQCLQLTEEDLRFAWMIRRVLNAVSSKPTGVQS